ncbi:unnamed protein product [Caenorhabditis sp. 36 PRJEB53466]|nr:unnamed protein product [Caenorhabditis sp. 36 PRJEB53466]
MGRVFKKKVGTKRAVEPEKKDVVVTKKAKKEEEPEPEPVEEVEEEDEDVSDEEEEEDNDDEDVEDEEDGDEEEEEDEMPDFPFKGDQPYDEDRDGIVNMLTQTFLRTDIDLVAMSEKIIAQSPFGIIVTPDLEEEDVEEDFMVCGLCTTVPLNEKKDDAPKFVKDIFGYLLNRAKKGAPTEIYKKIEEIQDEGDGKTALFINERLLNFNPQVVPATFSGIRTDIAGLEIAESDGNGDKAGSSSGGAAKKKGKMGKAEKKRAAAAALANAELEFDNPEDKILFELSEGKEVHFDYPVHMDVEPGSKFHIVEKGGKKWNPFRRVVIMDAKRFDAFLKKGATWSPV